MGVSALNVSIREEAAGESPDVESVIAAAFADAAHASGTEAEIVNRLRKAGALELSLVAKSDDGIVGHVAVSPVTISDGAAGWFGLGPISVLPWHQGTGIGSRLMEEALSHLKSCDAAGCVLVGEPDFYRRFGFRATPELTFAGVPPAYFQALAFAAPIPRGTVTYHNAFSVEG